MVQEKIAIRNMILNILDFKKGRYFYCNLKYIPFFISKADEL